jgi:hypothetical protein
MRVVEQNATLLRELLDTFDPSIRVAESELVPDIAVTCKSMQERVLTLCEQVLNEELVGELLQINDSLNEALQTYDRRVALDPPSVATPALPQRQELAATLPESAAVGSVYPSLSTLSNEQPPAAMVDPFLADFSPAPSTIPTRSAPSPPTTAAASITPPQVQTAPFDDIFKPPPAETVAAAAAAPPPSAAAAAAHSVNLLDLHSPPPPVAAAGSSSADLLDLDFGGAVSAPHSSRTDEAGMSFASNDLFGMSFAPIGGSAARPATAAPNPQPDLHGPAPAKKPATKINTMSEDRQRQMAAQEDEMFGL